MRRSLGALAAATLALLTTACCTVDQWFFDVTGPGAFTPGNAPTAPDYADLASWAAHPERKGGSDVALQQTPPTASPKAAVFYVHPTTALLDQWNAPVDDDDINVATENGGTRIQASAFNGCCEIYAPRYRQASGKAFVKASDDGEAAIAIALGDIERAFDVFLEQTGNQPFILAGHSQGAILLARLLTKRRAGAPWLARLVAAYLPGAPMRLGKLPLPACASSSQTGCVASWHARGPSYVANGLELEADVEDTMRGRLCVNPISWETPAAAADASRVGRKTNIKESRGAVFHDAPTPKLKPHFLTSQCRDGTLVVNDVGDLERDFMSRVLLFVSGPENYHPVEYQLFYEDIRQNAVERVNAFVAH